MHPFLSMINLYKKKFNWPSLVGFSLPITHLLIWYMHLSFILKNCLSKKSSVSSSCTPTFFFLHPHNFLNPDTGLNLLFEKGNRGYRK